MTVYDAALFLHIIGAICLFLGLGIELIILMHLKYIDSSDQFRQWSDTVKILRAFYIVAAILILIPGIYMVHDQWSWNSWIITAIILWAALTAYGNIIMKKKISDVIASLDMGNKPIPLDIKKQLIDPYLMKSYKIRIFVAVGIIFLMTIKPNWTGSIASVVIAFLFGLLMGVSSKNKIKQSDSETR